MSEQDLVRLREYIEATGSTGELRLPPEPRLSEELGLSRGRLRTLLKRLESEGLIWRHVGKGTFVGPRQIVAEGGDWSESVSVDNIIDARLLLEPQLAAQAAIRSTPADMAKIDDCLLEMSHATSYAQWKRLDDRLHRTIAEASHNVLMLALYDTLNSHVKKSLQERMEQLFSAGEAPEATIQEHGDFVEAIRKHDPIRAEEAMAEHLQSVRRRLFGLR